MKKSDEWKVVLRLYNSLFRNIEKGKIGKLDYEWDGKKVIRDNIIFTRKELLDFFRYRIYGKPKTSSSQSQAKTDKPSRVGSGK